MKAILISIWAFWASLIINGKKTIEVRKGTRLHKAIQKLIKEQGKAIIYIYVCKAKNKKDVVQCCFNEILDKETFCVYGDKEERTIAFTRHYTRGFSGYKPILNGKVVAKFEATSELIKYHFLKKRNIYYIAKFVSEYTTPTLTNSQLKERSCLSTSELEKYLNGPLEEKNIVGTAVRVVPNSLKVFDKPKEISEFNAYCKGGEKCLHCKHHWTDDSAGYSIDKCSGKSLTCAPQSWCYCEV